MSSFSSLEAPHCSDLLDYRTILISSEPSTRYTHTAPPIYIAVGGAGNQTGGEWLAKVGRGPPKANMYLAQTDAVGGSPVGPACTCSSILRGVHGWVGGWALTNRTLEVRVANSNNNPGIDFVVVVVFTKVCFVPFLFYVFTFFVSILCFASMVCALDSPSCQHHRYPVHGVSVMLTRRTVQCTNHNSETKS